MKSKLSFSMSTNCLIFPPTAFIKAANVSSSEQRLDTDAEQSNKLDEAELFTQVKVGGLEVEVSSTALRHLRLRGDDKGDESCGCDLDYSSEAELEAITADGVTLEKDMFTQVEDHFMDKLVNFSASPPIHLTVQSNKVHHQEELQEAERPSLDLEKMQQLTNPKQS